MKKLLLTTAAILALASPALANNGVSTINQTGAANTANVDQNDPDVTAASSTITQSGNNNMSTVTQRGDSSVGTGDLVSRIVQSGNSNAATVSQNITTNAINGFSDVTQSGNLNVANITQIDDAQRVTLVQSSNGNLANVNQGDAALAVGDHSWSNDATINQGGTGSHIANVTQTSLNATLNLTQNGFDNEALVNQGFGLFGSEDHVATISQIGSSSYVLVEQRGVTADGHDASISQNASLSEARVYQTGGNNQQGDITQNANSSFAVIVQTAGVTNLASITQNAGTGGYAGIEQNADNIDADITQTGSGHFARGRQDGIDNDFDITQTGTNNRADIRQNGNNNLLSVNQSGMGNTANVTQNTNANNLTVTQPGNNNSTTVTQ